MKPRRIALLPAFAVAGALLGIWTACLDVTPIIVENDAHDPEAGCSVCLHQPEGCVEVINACKADSTCQSIYVCMMALACLDQRRLDDKITCSLPCAVEAGVVTLTDPVITTYFLGLIQCAEKRCPEPCNMVDASIGIGL